MSRKAASDFVAIDASQFYKAIEDYVKVGHKDFAESVNRKTRDAFLQASRLAPRATRARIRAKYVGQYAYFSKAVYKANGGHPVEYQTTTTERKPDGGTRTRIRTRKHVFSNAERTAYYKATLRRALQRIGYVRAYLKSCADSINEVCHFKPVKPARLTGDSAFTCYVKRADQDGFDMQIRANYAYRRKNGSPTIIDNILEDSLERGFAAVEQDTSEYIERKLSENAKAHSA